MVTLTKTHSRGFFNIPYLIQGKVETFKPGLLAFSVSEDIFPTGLQLLERVRHLRIPTIFGGVFPTFAPEKCLSMDGIDIVCIGEGEHALVELCERLEKGIDYCNIPNLWVKKSNGMVVKNPMGPPTDIDANPLLDLRFFDDSRFYRPMQGKVWRMLPVETHRGCVYRCGYCNSPVQADLYRKETGKNYFRKKSVEAIRKELIYYRDVYKAEAFYFWADTFMAYTDREMDSFLEMYKEIGLPFWCQAFPESIREDRIKKMMNAGLFRLASGVEHGNEDFRTRILQRRVKNSTMVENFKILNKLGLPYSVNNILGFPTETRELAMDTIALNRQIDADSANAYSFSPFHGTPLRKMAEDLGFVSPDVIARSVTRPTLLNMSQFPMEEIEGLRRCFSLYVKMPKERWPDIGRAEKLTEEGNRIWKELRDECAEKYMSFSKRC